MRVFLAGATGALGLRLVPLLRAAGHEVIGMTRSADKLEQLRVLGAEPVLCDALDAAALTRVVGDAKPDALIHQLTALSGPFDMRRPERTFAATNRLRREGTDHLLAAAHTAGVRRFLAQSFTSWPFARSGGPIKNEDDPLDPTPPKQLRSTLDAIRHLEQAVTGIDWAQGVVLRYGAFYGPGTQLGCDPDGASVRAVRGRQFPLIGDGAGIWSHLHIEDAARATVAALDRSSRGIYNIVDDEPAPVREWLPFLAATLGAKPPRRLPRTLAKLLAGDAIVALMTESRGASNAKAKRELGWKPQFASWREGFAHGLSQRRAGAAAG